MRGSGYGAGFALGALVALASAMLFDHLRPAPAHEGYAVTPEAEQQRTECRAGKPGFVQADGEVSHVIEDGATTTLVPCACDHPPLREKDGPSVR